MQNTINEICNYAQNHFLNARHSHDWDHTIRVHNLCMKIGTAEKADLETLSIAAYLHDIGRSTQDLSQGKICHAHQGAEMASDILSAYDLKGRYDNIIHCIRSHRFRNDDRPETLEARILFDADKLDAIGAIGVARAYLFAGEIGAVLHNPDIEPELAESYSRNDTGYREYRVKLCRIKERMLTDAGKRMAEERHTFMESFFERFLLEHSGQI